LFPDVLKGCYVEGEISQAPPINSPLESIDSTELVNVPKTIEKINQDQMSELTHVLSHCAPEYREKVMSRMKDININSLFDMPVDVFTKLLPAAMKKAEEYQASLIQSETIEELPELNEEHEQMEMFDDN